MQHRVTFYYQTFEGLGSLKYVTHIHLSSVHFGIEPDGQPYIHLNNLYPDNPKFSTVWKELDRASDLGVKVILMIGGAGGGYNTLFSNYSTCYGLLRDLLRRHSCITGIDLDIEEQVELDNIKRLINDIKLDFPEYEIAMAPVQSSLQSDIPGMGGFVYKDLWNSPEGACIDYFNVQFYGDFSQEAYDQIVDNGYPPDKVVMGSLSGTGSIDVVSALATKYSTFGGVYSWEYYNTIPSPAEWAQGMAEAMLPDIFQFFKCI